MFINLRSAVTIARRRFCDQFLRTSKTVVSDAIICKENDPMKYLAGMAGLAFVLGSGSRLPAQAIPAATQTGSYQIGGGYSFASSDYGKVSIGGISIYAGVDLNRFVGIEVDAHKVSLKTPTDIGEDSYLIGPRFGYVYRRFHPYAKVMFGVGVFQRQPDVTPHTSASYGVLAAGGGLDIRVSHHVNVRAIDYEAQSWPGFEPNGLTPHVITFGAAYSFRSFRSFR